MEKTLIYRIDSHTIYRKMRRVDGRAVWRKHCRELPAVGDERETADRRAAHRGEKQPGYLSADLTRLTLV